MGSHIEDTYVRSETAKYWQFYLADCEPCFFPQLTDSVIVERQKGLRQYVSIDTAESGAIFADFCVLHNVTIADVLQTTWAVILGRYIGTDEVCFGSVMPSDKGKKAFTIRRAQLGSEDPISQVLTKLHKSVLESLPHAFSPNESQAVVLGKQALFNSTMNFRCHDGMSWDESLTKENEVEYDTGVGIPDPNVS